MSKRQAFPRTLTPPFVLLTSALICLLFLLGCSIKPVSQNPAKTTPIDLTKSAKVSPIPPQVSVTPQNEHRITPTTNCFVAGGSIEEINFYSPTTEADFFYKIYLPPCYDSNTDQYYPVLFLLHGLSYDNQQWIRLGLADHLDAMIESEQVSPFIVVLPLEARFDPPGLALFGDVIVNDLLQHVDANFRTLSEKTNRAIGGLSRGAAWSVRIGFEHYEIFSKVGAHSLPLFKSDVGHIQTWLSQIPREDVPLFYIDIGRDDPEWQSAQSFANQLDQNAVPHEWHLFNNGHSESYWTAHLTQYLQWYARNW